MLWQSTDMLSIWVVTSQAQQSIQFLDFRKMALGAWLSQLKWEGSESRHASPWSTSLVNGLLSKYRHVEINKFSPHFFFQSWCRGYPLCSHDFPFRKWHVGDSKVPELSFPHANLPIPFICLTYLNTCSWKFSHLNRSEVHLLITTKLSVRHSSLSH